ncbi:hypothetical protein HK101_002135, partial [Irineochytrium annulatum]
VMILNIMAAYMFLTVCMSWNVDFGAYDYILHGLTFGVPVVYVIVGLSVGAIGPDLYWCYLNVSVTAGQIYWIITLVAALACIFLPAGLYFLIFRALAANTRRMGGDGKSSTGNESTMSANASEVASSNNSVNAATDAKEGGGKKKAEKESPAKRAQRRVSRKLLVVIFKQEPIWLVFMVVIMFNSAGWMNAAVFLKQDRAEKVQRRSQANAVGAMEMQKKNAAGGEA